MVGGAWRSIKVSCDLRLHSLAGSSDTPLAAFIVLLIVSWMLIARGCCRGGSGPPLKDPGPRVKGSECRRELAPTRRVHDVENVRCSCARHTVCIEKFESNL